MEKKAQRPDDPTKVGDEPARIAIVRSVGSTPSERYLAKLADKSFLNLWSYPNTYIDKRTGGKGDGKELCDLLVVCGDHVLIFSDKTVAWPTGNDTKLAWKRWYRRAVGKSVDQIRGAERWIAEFPEKIFLDRQCTQPLPIKLPPRESRRIHGIVVALGAGKACKDYFGGGIGSLIVNPAVKGDVHYKNEVAPFEIGDVDPTGPFVHVLDDATLDIVLGELDTITDLTDYLTKKEHIIRSGILTLAAGEEELVAYYMTHMNSLDEHDFTKPDGTSLGDNEHIGLDVGFYDDLKNNKQYQAKKIADQVSYGWDRLIERFTSHMLAGTSVIPAGKHFALSELEEGVRHMALVSRFERRIYSEAILDAWEKSNSADRFTRALLPNPEDDDHDTGFFFMTLAIPKFEVDGGYEGYRKLRRTFLEVYAYTLLEKHRYLKRIVGIGTEPRAKLGKEGSSEDLIVLEPTTAASEWTPEFLQHLEKTKKGLNIAQEGNFTAYSVHDDEFPGVEAVALDTSGAQAPNRQQRRAAAATARKHK